MQFKFQFDNQWIKLFMFSLLFFVLIWTFVIYFSLWFSRTQSQTPANDIRTFYSFQEDFNVNPPYQTLLVSIPFIRNQISRLKQAFETWKIFLPCNKNKFPLPFTRHFGFNLPKLAFYI